MDRKDFSLNECNYLELSDSSSVDSSPNSSSLENNKCNLNLKATELRLGLTGFESPERDKEFEELALRPRKDGIFGPTQKAVFSGNKRGLHERSRITKESKTFTNSGNATTAKARVVGWPPLRSFRKNALAATSKNNGEGDRKPAPGTTLVKVSMNGAPYLRKVDLRSYKTYQELSSSLGEMFRCFTTGQCGSHGLRNGKLSKSKLRDLLNGPEYVLTYEDKDGDWMLVGDVPWAMFTETCKRLKIMKGSDAIGLAPRAMGRSNKA